MTGLRWTEKVWKSCGPEPTVSGCWTMTRTVPELVPYAISIQFPLSPDRAGNVQRQCCLVFNWQNQMFTDSWKTFTACVQWRLKHILVLGVR